MYKKTILMAMLTLISSISSLSHAQDAAAGKASYQVCVTCHGQKGEGNKALNAPSLGGQFDWYVERQLKNYKQGIRGADAKDIYGSQMRPMALTLPDDKAVKNVATYIKTLPAAKPVPTLGGDAANGRRLYVVCATCHGQKAEGMPALNSPRLNTLSDWYMLRQLQNYKDGIRGKHAKDVYGQQMVPMAMTLADGQAMKDVIAYILSLR